MLYKMYYSLVEIDQQKHLELAGRSSRHMHKLSDKVLTSKANYHLGSFFSNAIKDWNSLTLNVVEAHEFLRNQARHFFSFINWAQDLPVLEKAINRMKALRNFLVRSIKVTNSSLSQ